MVQVETMFKNPFSSDEITPNRLHVFADDVVGKLDADNANGEFNGIINNINTASQNLKDELGDVETTVAVQKGKTLTVNDVIKEFKTYMSDNEGVIAKAVGGKKKPAFLEFYPQGVSQYSNITKTKIDSVLDQVFNAADNNKVAIGKDLEKELKAFKADYTAARKLQVNQKGTVKDNRVDKTNNRKALEIALLQATYTVGNSFTGDVAKCSSFFNFSLLYAVSGGKKAKVVTPNK